MANINKSNVSICQTVQLGELKKTVDSELIVPDYLPDVKKIIRVDAFPITSDVKAEREKIVFTGQIEYAIVYLPESSQSLRCLRSISDFEQVFEVRGVDESCRVFTTDKLSYLNCKILNSRKLMLGVGIVFDTTVERDQELSLVAPAQCAEYKVECVEISHDCSTFAGEGRSLFSVEEELEIGDAKQPAAMLVYTSCTPVMLDSKTVGGKILVKGELKVRSLYLIDMETGKLDSVENSVPFNQIVEVPGIDENSLCVFDIKCLSSDYALYENGAGENRIISLNANIQIDCAAYQTVQLELVSDAYCPVNAFSVHNSTVDFERQCDTVSDTISVKGDLATEEDIEAVLSTSGVAYVTGCTVENGALVVKGDVSLSVIYKESEGEVEGDDTTIPFSAELALPLTCSEYRCRAQAELVNISYIISSARTVELRATVQVSGIVRCINQVELIDDIQLSDEDTHRSNDYLVLYYSKPNEKLWDIAKRYSSTVAKLKSVNNLSDDFTEGQMILIPRSCN